MAEEEPRKVNDECDFHWFYHDIPDTPYMYSKKLLVRAVRITRDMN